MIVQPVVEPMEHYTALMLTPAQDWPRVEDPSIIAPFYSRCKIGELNGNEGDDGLDEHANKKPGVYFRSVGKSHFIQHLLNFMSPIKVCFETHRRKGNICDKQSIYLENT